VYALNFCVCLVGTKYSEQHHKGIHLDFVRLDSELTYLRSLSVMDYVSNY